MSFTKRLVSAALLLVMLGFSVAAEANAPGQGRRRVTRHATRKRAQAPARHTRRATPATKDRASGDPLAGLPGF